MIIVCGGSPSLNRLVVGHLVGRAPPDQIAVVADGGAGGGDWHGVQVRSPGAGESIASVTLFAGAERVLVTADGRSYLTQSQADAAVAAGARRLVYAAILDEDYPQWGYSDESAVGWTGVASHTIVRLNLPSESIAPAIALARDTGELVCAFGSGLLASAALTDYAGALAEVLVGDGHDAQTYQLAGTIGLKPLGVAAIASNVAGRMIAVREVPATDLADELGRAGADQAVVTELERVYRIIRGGGAHHASTTLGRLLGRIPLTVEQAVRAALAPDRPPVRPGAPGRTDS